MALDDAIYQHLAGCRYHHTAAGVHGVQQTIELHRGCGGDGDVSAVGWGRIGERTVPGGVGHEEAQRVERQAGNSVGVIKYGRDIASRPHSAAAVGLDTVFVPTFATNDHRTTADADRCVFTGPNTFVDSIQASTGEQSAQEVEFACCDFNLAVFFVGVDFDSAVNGQGIARHQNHFGSGFDGGSVHIPLVVRNYNLAAQGQVPTGIQLEALVVAGDVDGHGINIYIPVGLQRKRTVKGQGVLQIDVAAHAHIDVIFGVYSPNGGADDPTSQGQIFGFNQQTGFCLDLTGIRLDRQRTMGGFQVHQR